MPLIAVVHLALAAYFGVHAMRTGRPYWWLFVLLSFPMLGSVIYFFAEYLPTMRHTRGGIKAARAIDHILDPQPRAARASARVRPTPTAYNRARLAAGAARAGPRRGIDRPMARRPRAARMRAMPCSCAASAGAAAAASTTPMPSRASKRLFEAHPDQRSGAPR
jgi:hypothetical protein